MQGRPFAVWRFGGACGRQRARIGHVSIDTVRIRQPSPSSFFLLHERQSKVIDFSHTNLHSTSIKSQSSLKLRIRTNPSNQRVSHKLISKTSIQDGKHPQPFPIHHIFNLANHAPSLISPSPSYSKRAQDFCFFIPVIFGCPTKIKQEGDGSARVCPRCQNAQVVQAKSKRWFELCWIPLIPLGSKHIYFCNICQWQAAQDGGFQPQVAGGGFGGHQGQPQQYGYGPPQQQGYGYPPPKH